MSANKPSAAGSSSAPTYGQVTPTVLSWLVVGRYWQLLHERPAELAQLYTDDARLLRSEAGPKPTTDLQGRNQIAQFYGSHISGAYVYVRTIDSVPAGPHQLLTHIVGELALPTSGDHMLPFRPFTQSLLLNSHVCSPSNPIDTPGLITIASDILRLEAEEDPEVAPAANGTVTPTAQSAAPPTAATPSEVQPVAESVAHWPNGTAVPVAAPSTEQFTEPTTPVPPTQETVPKVVEAPRAQQPPPAAQSHSEVASTVPPSAPASTTSVATDTAPVQEKKWKVAPSTEASPWVAESDASAPTHPASVAPEAQPTATTEPAAVPRSTSASTSTSTSTAPATPAPSAAPAPAPAAPTAPPAPKQSSWASLAAKNKPAEIDAKAESKAVPIVAPVAPSPASAATTRRMSTVSTTSSLPAGSESESKPTPVATGITGPAGSTTTSAAALLNQGESSVFLKPVPETIKAKSLMTALSQFGRVDNVHMVQGKACAFVDFNTSDAARRALEASTARGGITLTTVAGQPKVLVEPKRRFNQDAPGKAVKQVPKVAVPPKKSASSTKPKESTKGDQEGFQAVSKGRRR